MAGTRKVQARMVAEHAASTTNSAVWSPVCAVEGRDQRHRADRDPQRQQILDRVGPRPPALAQMPPQEPGGDRDLAEHEQHHRQRQGGGPAARRERHGQQQGRLDALDREQQRSGTPTVEQAADRQLGEGGGTEDQRRDHAHQHQSRPGQPLGQELGQGDGGAGKDEPAEQAADGDEGDDPQLVARLFRRAPAVPSGPTVCAEAGMVA